jgi:hypothetical protein
MSLINAIRYTPFLIMDMRLKFGSTYKFKQILTEYDHLLGNDMLNTA